MTEQEKREKRTELWKEFFQEFKALQEQMKTLEAILNEARALKNREKRY